MKGYSEDPEHKFSFVFRMVKFYNSLTSYLLWYSSLILDKDYEYHSYIAILIVCVFSIIVIIMGSTCSTIQTGGEIDISGNGNSAIIINGLRHNVSNMFNTAVNLITQKYRFELILIHFTSVLLMMISTLFIIRFLMSHSAVEKGKRA